MIYDPPKTSAIWFNILAKVGAFTRKLGFQFPLVNAKNRFSNAPKPTQIYEQRQRMFKGNF